MEELVTLVTFQVLKDQLFVPLWSVLGPSFFSVMYVMLSILYCPFPIRLT